MLAWGSVRFLPCQQRFFRAHGEQQVIHVEERLPAAVVHGGVTAGAGYARVTRPYAAEIAALRSRAEFVDLIEQRVVTMTGSERRQFDALLKGKARDKR